MIPYSSPFFIVLQMSSLTMLSLITIDQHLVVKVVQQTSKLQLHQKSTSLGIPVKHMNSKNLGVSGRNSLIFTVFVTFGYENCRREESQQF